MTIPFQTYFAIGAIATMIILIQRRLHRSAASWMPRWFAEERAARRAQAAVSGAFLLLNLPWVILSAVAASNRLELWITISDARFSAVQWVMYPFAIWQTGGVTIWLFLSAADAGRWLSRRWKAWRGRESIIPEFDSRTHPGRREWIQAAGTSLAALPFAASGYGAVVATRSYTVERPEIVIPGWPKQLDGLRIAQLTDIHVGLFMTEERLREVVGVVNRLEADLVALTGDFVSSSRVYVAPCIRALSELRAGLGVYACVGNHDLFTGSVGALDEGFRAHGIRLLFNERESVLYRGHGLHLIGIDFVRQDGRVYSQVMRGIPITPGTVLLSHQPNVFPRAAEQQIDLQLSGHTHGGQVRFEIMGQEISPARLITPFVRGHYAKGGSHLYVSRGVGTTGPPLRLNAPPEITLLTVRGA
ncbi:MAG: metallophosphoesterase [Acidobacteria bacterium]|nr:metallophosphoesterase [Acidobacteriota bacterium]